MSVSHRHNIMTDIKKIHNIHMQVSYNMDHNIYKYIENKTNTNNIGFNRKYIISHNQFNRYDMSIQILKGYIYTEQQIFYNLLKDSVISNIDLSVNKINQYIESDKLLMINNPFTNKILRIISDYVCEYEQQYELYLVDKNITLFIDWINNLYIKLRILYMNDNTIPDTFIALLYFLGTIEWFHLLVIKIMYTSIYKCEYNMIIFMGEHTQINLEYLTEYTIQEIRNYLTEEYCSHTILYIIISNNIYIYDSDYDDKYYKILKRHIDNMCNILNKIYIPIYINHSIQELTDDPYCVFHCIWFILRLIDMNITIYNFENFTKYVGFINDNTKKTDIYFFIKDLDFKATFFYKNK